MIVGRPFRREKLVANHLTADFYLVYAEILSIRDQRRGHYPRQASVALARNVCHVVAPWSHLRDYPQTRKLELRCRKRLLGEDSLFSLEDRIALAAGRMSPFWPALFTQHT